MSGNASPPMGLSPTELDTYAQYAWLSGRVSEAIDLYSDLARLYRRSPHVHFKLGYLYLSLQDNVSAVKHFTLEIERYGDDVVEPAVPADSPSPSPEQLQPQQQQQQRAFLFCTYAGRCDALRALGESSKAELDQLFLSNRDGNSKSVLLAMGRLYSRFGILPRADACFEKYAALGSHDSEYLVEHAELRLAQRRHALAASMFEKCRHHTNSVSPTYHRALIGEGAALIRQDKLQDAVILLLQAMNTLRNTIRTTLSHPFTPTQGTGAGVVDHTAELVHLYHRAINMYGGLCLMKGELKAALDTFCSIFQPDSSFTEIVPFYLPTMCLVPGTKNHNGETVDSTKMSSKNVAESIRHLNELEWRYGPDPCLYFHRANLHRATGEFEAFVHDLSLVESMDPGFLTKYIKLDCLGDFLDVETISWIPTTLVEAIHEALERNEYRLRPATTVAPAVGTTASGGPKQKAKNGNPQLQKQRSFSEVAMLLYLRERDKKDKTGDDTFAQVYQLDVFRRLPESKRQAGQLKLVELAQWEGVIFDDVYAGDDKSADEDQSQQDFIRTSIASNNSHPCVFMFAGMIALEQCDGDAASKHFTRAIDLVDKDTPSNPHTQASSLTLSQRWSQQLMLRVKYYSLVWRSMTHRLRIEMEKAVEDLNVAAAVPLGGHQSGADDPLLVVQRTLIMLLNGHLKSAYKLLRVLKKSLRLARRNRLSPGIPIASEALDVIDMFSCAGLNCFHLLPLQVQNEASRVANGHAANALSVRQRGNSTSTVLNEREKAEEEKEEREEEVTAISMVKYALTKKAIPQTEMLDKFYESGLLKLVVTGNISQVIPFFQAILSIDEGYLPPTNFASLEIFKCKEQDFMEEKLFNCFVRLGKRSKWLDKRIKWRFEALIDANLAHAYLPSDMETLWHRSRLLQGQRNYYAAINDLNDCLHLMAVHFSWQKGKKGEKATFGNETKRTQWLQLQLERGVLQMELRRWEHAIDDLTMVIAQAGKKSIALQAGALEARTNCLVHMRRYGHAIHDLQHLLALSKEAKTIKNASVEDLRRREDRMLNCVLVGNLYCQLAADQMKAGSALARKTAVMSLNPLSMKQTKLAHVNMGFIARAGAYYDDAEAMVSDHFLVHYFRGRMYALSGQSQLATKSLTQCLRLHTMFLPALFLRGCIYAQENLFVLALADYYRVRHRIATYPNLHTSIGYCHLERGSLLKAVESFTEAILQCADDTDALYMRGCALQELMVLGNALKDFNQVVNIKPDYYRAHYQLAVCQILLKDYKSAIQAMNAVVRLQPEWRDAWILHGYACFCAARFETAASSYGSAISFPDTSEGTNRSRQQDSALLFFRAVCYMQCGKLTAALVDLDLALKRDNENYVAFLAKAFCLSQTGERARAAQTLAHCLPHYKQIKLPPASEVIESERIKEQIKADAVRDGVLAQPSASLLSPSVNHKSFLTTTATVEALFHHRKFVRDCEPKQIMRPISLVLGERRTSSTNPLDGRYTSTTPNNLDRKSSSVVEPTPGEGSPTSRHFSTTSFVPSVDPNEELAKARAKQALRTKFLRAIKKITFQYRVLKALEDATSSKYKKSQVLTRALAETLRPPDRVPWPKGTLTSRILLWAFNEFGIHHTSERSVDDALLAFTLAIQSHPRSSDTHFNRGNVYLQMNVLHSAISGYQDAVDEEQDCFRAQNNMGVALYKMKRFDEAHEAFATGLHHAEGHKERAILMYNLGATLQALERPDEALELYQQAIALDASRTEFFNNRSAILHHQMRYAVALEDYNRALRLQHPPSSPNGQLVPTQTPSDEGNGVVARLNRAQLFIAMGNCTLALRDLTVVVKNLTEMRDRMPREQGRDLTRPFASADTEAKLESLDADIRFTSDLLAFSRKWRAAMRIAVKDFLFALHALPYLSEFEFSPLFGPELVRLQVEEADRLYTIGSSEDPVDSDRLQFVPLPIQDHSFFDFEREFGHWIVSDDVEDPNEAADLENHVFVRASKCDQWTKPYSSDVREALRYAREGNFQYASRSLLRAHYKTTLDSHDEYLLLAWRIQVTLRIETPEEGTDYGLAQAIVVLRDFLQERRPPEEIGNDQDQLVEANVSTRRPQIQGGNDLEEDDEHGEWRWQRRVIRADLFTLLGALYQLNGELSEARVTFQRALRVRSDHVIAMLNYLQLSVVVGEYEAVLDVSLQLLDILVNHGNATTVMKESRCPSGGMRVYPGLLNANRSLFSMLPSVAPGFVHADVCAFAVQMLSLLKEYRGLVSAQIQTNTANIFKVQGGIAHVVQQLRCVASKQAKEQAALASDASSSTPVDLTAFNNTLEKYHDKIRQDPTQFANASDFDEFYATFQAQFAELCDEVVKTLPITSRTESDEDQDAIPAVDAVQTNETGDNQDTDETIEAFLATLDRNRRESMRPQPRPLSALHADSTTTSSAPLRPQRPNTGPSNTSRRRRLP